MEHIRESNQDIHPFQKTFQSDFPAFSLLRRRRFSNSSRVIRVPRIVSQCMKNGCEKLLFIPMTYKESVRRSAVLKMKPVHTW